MVIRIHTGFPQGLTGVAVEVEVHVGPGLPAFQIVGLGDAAVQEARKRVEAALESIGVSFPRKKVTVNLSPAHLNKHGTLYDVPIALGLLVAMEQCPMPQQRHFVFGELSLDGTIRGIPGALALGDFAKQQGFTVVIGPEENGEEVGILPDITFVGVASLGELIHYLQGGKKQVPKRTSPKVSWEPAKGVQLSDIHGHALAKRVLMIAAAGGHNLLLSGPPGAGKTMLSKALLSLRTPMSIEEALEVTKIYSIARLLPNGVGVVGTRPFRSVHHTISDVAMVGGGKELRPGEISLAHQGVLHLDELGEFSRYTLESLRQPMEEGYITLSRASGTVTYPALFQVVATTNPCPCGFYGSSTKPCTCSRNDRLRYQKKFSGPLLDRFDLLLHVESQQLGDMKATTQSDQWFQNEVVQAKKRQQQRSSRPNTQLTLTELQSMLAPNDTKVAALRYRLEKQGASNRVQLRVLRVARTIADLEGASVIESHHVLEAMHYRGEERHKEPIKPVSG